MEAAGGRWCSSRHGRIPVSLGCLVPGLQALDRDKGRPRVLGFANAAGTQTIACSNTPVPIAPTSSSMFTLAHTIWEVRHIPQHVPIEVATKWVRVQSVSAAITGVKLMQINKGYSDGTGNRSRETIYTFRLWLCHQSCKKGATGTVLRIGKDLGKKDARP